MNGLVGGPLFVGGLGPGPPVLPSPLNPALPKIYQARETGSNVKRGEESRPMFRQEQEDLSLTLSSWSCS